MERIGEHCKMGDEVMSNKTEAAPLDRPIAVTAWRTAATDIPTDPAARIAWLDDQWLRVDDWIDRHAGGER